MALADRLFNYCERAADPSLWAEPLNAASNLGFLLVAGIALLRLSREPETQQEPARAVLRTRLVLAVLTALVGLGSLAFHVLATRLAQLADAAPIGAFMVLYLAAALRLMLRVDRPRVVLLATAFALVSLAASALPCPLPAGFVAGAPCLNGSLGYVPALASLALVAALARGRHPGAGHLLLAAVVLAGALVLRTLDFELCGPSTTLGRPRGTHALWHLSVALVLHLLLAALAPRPHETRPT